MEKSCMEKKIEIFKLMFLCNCHVFPLWKRSALQHSLCTYYRNNILQKNILNSKSNVMFLDSLLQLLIILTFNEHFNNIWFNIYIYIIITSIVFEMWLKCKILLLKYCFTNKHSRKSGCIYITGFFPVLGVTLYK